MGHESAPGQQSFLLIRVHKHLCAIPVSSTIETMRPLETDRFPGAPEFVLGTAVIRGTSTPVLSLGRLLNVPDHNAPRRYVLIRAGDNRIVAMAVDEVLGISSLETERIAKTDSLLQAASNEYISSIQVRDRRLLFILETSRLLTDDLQDLLFQGGAEQ